MNGKMNRLCFVFICLALVTGCAPQKDTLQPKVNSQAFTPPDTKSGQRQSADSFPESLTPQAQAHNQNLSNNPETTQQIILNLSTRQIQNDSLLDLEKRSGAEKIEPKMISATTFWSLDKIIMECNQALAQDANLIDAYILRGLAVFESDYKQAVCDFTTALSLNPRRGEVYVYRGKLHETQGEHDLAMADYARARALDPGLDALWLQAKQFLILE